MTDRIATKCPICDCVITDDNAAKHDDGRARLDSTGRRWCQPCVDKHDSIDWDEVYGDDPTEVMTAVGYMVKP